MAKCTETAGFLISAPCKNTADGKCQRCKKPICPKHQRKNSNAQVLCITCHRKSGRYNTQDDDPYLYSGFYYDDYYERSYRAGDWDSSDAFDTQDYGDSDWENDFDGS